MVAEANDIQGIRKCQGGVKYKKTSLSLQEEMINCCVGIGTRGSLPISNDADLPHYYYWS